VKDSRLLVALDKIVLVDNVTAGGVAISEPVLKNGSSTDGALMYLGQLSYFENSIETVGSTERPQD
jgi:hypothetical protein